jgi:hypothetical protein
MYEAETTLILKLDLNPDSLEAVAKQVIYLIEKRTANGRDKRGNPFKGYSEEYKKSMDYLAAGKTGQVNLRLSGEMMTDLDVTNLTARTVAIGFPDDEKRAIAHGHITGANGNLPVRDFMGISKEELATAIRKSGVVRTEAEVQDLVSRGSIL